MFTLVSSMMYSSKTKKILLIAIVAMCALLVFVNVAYATGDPSEAIQDGVKDGTRQIYIIMTAIIAPIACIAFAWCGYQALLGGQRGMEEAKRFALKIVIGIAIIYLAPLIVQQVGSWFSNVGDGGIFD